jgi:hypothetical protein
MSMANQGFMMMLTATPAPVDDSPHPVREQLEPGWMVHNMKVSPGLIDDWTAYNPSITQVPLSRQGNMMATAHRQLPWHGAVLDKGRSFNAVCRTL